MVQGQVSLVEHLLLLNSLLPVVDGVLENVELPLVPASIVRLVSLLASLQYPSKELSRSAFRQPSSLKELEKSLSALEIFGLIY